MGAEIKIQHMTIDGQPITCPECDTASFTLDARGPIDILATVWASCANYHSWEDPLLDIGDLRAIRAASAGREKAGDIDTFRVVIGGALLEGVIQPEVLLDDLKKVAQEVYWGRMLKPALRRRKRAAIRAVTQPIRTGRQAVGAAATDTVAAAKAAAIGAAWDWQTPGGDPDPDYKPDPITACPFCTRGRIAIESNLHDTEDVHCSVCFGTGQID